MTDIPRPLPDHPSLDMLRKQARRLARDHQPPLTLRQAQLMLARIHGFAGWDDLRREALERRDRSLVWAWGRARRALHADDGDALRQLIAAYPALLAYRNADGASLLSVAAAGRPACAELLIDAGAVPDDGLWHQAVDHHARDMLDLLGRRGMLPRNAVVLAAAGDHGCLRAPPDEVDAAFIAAAGFGHRDLALALLARDAALAGRVDAGPGRAAFVDWFAGRPERFGDAWTTYAMNQALQAIATDDRSAFDGWLAGDAMLFDDPARQVALIEHAVLHDRPCFITALIERGWLVPAPRSDALVFALEYGRAYLVPLLVRIWPLPDDLPHAAGIGNLAAVRRWFDAAGRPALGVLARHYPANDARKRGHLHWGAPRTQHVLDTALAWACMNREIEVAAFLADHGADVNTDWSTHEPAGILHECALQGNYAAARFLIARGIDLDRRDHRWNATAEGWAWHAARDQDMTAFLAAAAASRGPAQG